MVSRVWNAPVRGPFHAGFPAFDKFGVVSDPQERPGLFRVADVPPLDVDGVRTLEVGTALWAVAFVALLPFYGSLQESGRLWWLWTCTAGLGLGLLGIDHCRRRRARSQRETVTPPPAGGGGGGKRRAR